MRHSRRNGLIAAVVAGGGLAVAGAGGFAYADADADGRTERSPGVLAGNLVQLPVDVPVNACGNTVSVIGLLNPAAGNRCANKSDAEPGSSNPSKHGAGTTGGAAAGGHAQGSPGVLSGNGLQLPVDLPVNVSGNAVNVVGIGNSSSGNSSVNGEVPPAVTPPVTPPVAPVAKPPVQPPAPEQESPVTQPAPPRHTEALAHTGSDAVGYLLPGGGALLLGGVLLYRRFGLSR